MGCFNSKFIQKEREKHLNQTICELRKEINRLKSISDKIAFESIYLKEKISFLELERKRISI